MDKEVLKYRMICTLTFGDIYGQIIIWLIVIFLTLASTLALGIVLVLSLPFLLFAFVTTLLNHIEFTPIEEEETHRKPTSKTAVSPSQKPAQAAS